MKRRMRILFICYDGATKSTMAASLAQAHGADDLVADVAGLYTAKPATEATKRVLEARGLPLPKPARHAPEASTRDADLIVSFAAGAQTMYGRPTRHVRTRTLAITGDDRSHDCLLQEIEKHVLDLLYEVGAKRAPPLTPRRA